ncbi:MAG: ferrous iron transport protein A [Eubacteriales bacterium SKADARSKE-1]|nr:ferrous iron transport protein A [Eubacteriales bacterium SKADARSKE-1]
MQNRSLPLDKLCLDQEGKVSRLLFKGNKRRQMMDLGIVEGTKLKVALKSHSGNPMAYLIRGAVIALRNEDACKILIKKI